MTKISKIIFCSGFEDIYFKCCVNRSSCEHDKVKSFYDPMWRQKSDSILGWGGQKNGEKGIVLDVPDDINDIIVLK